MIINNNVGRKGSGAHQRGERVHHFVETEFKIDDVTMRGDVFKSIVRHLDGWRPVARNSAAMGAGPAKESGIAPSVFRSFAPKFLESVEVLVDGNEFLCSNCWVKKRAMASAHKKNYFVREVVELAKIPSQQCVVSGQPWFLSP